MANCPRCNMPLQEGAPYCPNCRLVFNHGSRQPQMNHEQQMQQAQQFNRQQTQYNPPEQFSRPQAQYNPPEQYSQPQEPVEGPRRQAAAAAEALKGFGAGMKNAAMAGFGKVSDMMKTDDGVMDQTIALGDGEHIVRRYAIGRFAKGAGSAEIIVTNRRVLRYEACAKVGMNKRSIEELRIDAVTGICCEIRKSIAAGPVVLSVLLLVVSIVLARIAAVTRGNPLLLTIGHLVLLALAALIIIGCIRPAARFCLYGHTGTPVLSVAVNGIGKRIGRDPGLAYDLDEVNRMMTELGAVIGDIHDHGDQAAARWAQRS